MRRLFALQAFLLAAGWAAAASAQQAEPAIPPVVEIRLVSGSALSVDQSYVRAHVAVKAGEPYNRVAAGRDVATLLKTGRFSDVAALVEEAPGGVALTYKVVPKPKLGAPVSVLGARAIRVSKVISELDLQPGDWVDEAALGPRAKAVEELYRREGYADAVVESSLTLIDTHAGLCAVAVRIREGEPRRLKSIAFSGNGNVGNNTLRTLLDLPKSWNPWYWFRKPNYDAAEMGRRLDDVRNYYRDLGYLDAKVHTPVVETASYGRLRLTVTVEEGPLYKVGGVTVRGVKLFPHAEVTKESALKRGDTAAMAAIRDASKAMRDFYGARGYIRTSVEGVLTPAGPGVMDVAFEVREGRLTKVGDVVIRGNVVTKEKVIRREVNVYPGEVFNEVKVEQTERRLMNLNYFENVSGYPAPSLAPGTNDLVIDVLEKPTGLFTIGAGFSSVDSLMGYTEITQGNFDLLGWPSFTGGGQRLKLSLRAGTKMNEYSLSLLEPWFLDRPLALSGEIYTMSRSYSEYDVTRTGVSPALGFPVPLGARMELRYRLEHVSISNVSDTDPYTDVDGSTFYFTEDDAHTDSSLGTTISKDRRDNPMLPTRGYRLSAGSILTGGPMGFDTDLYSVSVKGEQHFPLWLRHVLSLRASAEVEDAYGSTADVPISERYFLGGPRTVRGIKYRDAGPKATRQVPNPDGTTYTDYQPRGGQTLLLASAEYTVPAGVPHIRFAAFFDIGSLEVDPYDFSCKEYAWGTGIGLRLDIPGFPVRLDYAFDTGVGTDRELDKTRTERWSFWIGYGF
jgi:outer membrane protein insertion porin family